MKPATIVRIVLVTLGIACATLLAYAAFGIRFTQDFLPFLDMARDTVGFVVRPFELLLVTPVVDWLHEHGWVFELREHWREAFVLLWLFSAADMRATVSPSRFFGGEGIGAAIRTPFRWTWAVLAALIGGALQGSVPLDHPAVLWWPVMAYFLYQGGDGFIYAFTDRLRAATGALALVLVIPFTALALGRLEPPAIVGQPPLFWWALAGYFAHRTSVALRWIVAGEGNIAWLVLYLILSVLTVALALGVLPGPAWLDFQHSRSPGLNNLATFAAILAAWFVVLAVLDPGEGAGGYLARVFSNPWGRTALDVFAVLSGAAIVTYGAQLSA